MPIVIIAEYLKISVSTIFFGIKIVNISGVFQVIPFIR
jgi:hypothetical protein